MHAFTSLKTNWMVLATGLLLCSTATTALAAIVARPASAPAKVRARQPLPVPALRGSVLRKDEEAFARCLAYRDAGDWATAGLCLHNFWDAHAASPFAYEALNLAAKAYEKSGHLALAIKLREVLAVDYLATDGGLESVLALPGLYAELGLGSVYPAAPAWPGEGIGERFLDVPEARMRAGKHRLEVVPARPLR